MIAQAAVGVMPVPDTPVVPYTTTTTTDSNSDHALVLV